jgi:hypothetical protein
MSAGKSIFTVIPACPILSMGQVGIQFSTRDKLESSQTTII